MPNNILYNMIPRAQTSIDGFAGAFLVKTSGDMYLGDPFYHKIFRI